MNGDHSPSRKPMLASFFFDMLRTIIYTCSFVSVGAIGLAYHMYSRFTSRNNVYALLTSPSGLEVIADAGEHMKIDVPTMAEAIKYHAKISTGVKAKREPCPFRALFGAVPQFSKMYPSKFTKRFRD